MFFTVMFGEFLAFLSEMLLHEWVDNDLFADCVSCNLPAKLVCPARLCLDIATFVCTLVLVMIFIHLQNKFVNCYR